MIGPTGHGASAPADERRRYLAHRQVAITPRDRPVIAGILRTDTVADLAPDAQVNGLLPHDAALVLERTDPDLVLIESRALVSGYPWSGAGEPSVADAAGRLRRVLDVAHGLGRPTALWWSGPRHQAPGLIPFESRFDVVLAADPGSDDGSAAAWDPGVQLTRFHPIGAPSRRTMRPVAHGPWDQPPRAGIGTFTMRALAALADDDLELWVDADATSDDAWPAASLAGGTPRRVTSRDLADRYRAHGLFLAAPFVPAHERGAATVGTARQLATGARVVGGPNASLAGHLGEWIAWAADPEAVREVVRAAQAEPRSPSELRAILRVLFGRHDTSNALRSLSRFVGIEASTPRRDVCAVAVLDGRARPADFLDTIVLQRHRPSEVLLLATAPDDAHVALRELDRLGIPGRAIRATATDVGLTRHAADATSADWLWIWTPGQDMDPWFLTDSVIAGLMSGATAVGRAAGRADGFFDGNGLGAHIVARDAARTLPSDRDGWSASWATRGATAYAVAADPGRS